MARSVVPEQELPARLYRLAICRAFTCLVAGLCVMAEPLRAAGTPAGTLIENVSSVEFELNGASYSLQSNTVQIAVDERIDVALASLSPQVLSSSGSASQALAFSLTNTGNGSETFLLDFDHELSGDDFDPLAASPAIYLDSDGSGDLSAGDSAYFQGSNDPLLAADQTLVVLLVADLPGGLVQGARGSSELRAVAATGSGLPGDSFAGAGDGGVDAVVGMTGGSSALASDFVIDGVSLQVSKSVSVLDPSGGNLPQPGATLSYTIDVEVVGAAVAPGSELNDPIPDNTTYVPASLELNGISLSDADDGDAGEFTTQPTDTVRVRLGDLTAADGIQTVRFRVTID